MTKSIAVTPYFERAEGKDDDVAETYVAGLRGARGANVGVEVVLPARLVERTVLFGARLSISLAPDGRIVLDAEGLDSETIEAASKAGSLAKQTLGSVIADCLRLDLLEGEDEAYAIGRAAGRPDVLVLSEARGEGAAGRVLARVHEDADRACAPLGGVT